MQVPQEVINNLIQTVVAAQQATATTAQRRQAIELSEQVLRAIWLLTGPPLRAMPQLAPLQ